MPNYFYHLFKHYKNTCSCIHVKLVPVTLSFRQTFVPRHTGTSCHPAPRRRKTGCHADLLHSTTTHTALTTVGFGLGTAWCTRTKAGDIQRLFDLYQWSDDGGMRERGQTGVVVVVVDQVHGEVAIAVVVTCNVWNDNMVELQSRYMYIYICNDRIL